MEKYEINIRSPFFGEDGLTSTSANHIANIAKEYYQSLEAELDATNFIKEEIAIVGSIEKTETNTGTPDILNAVDENIKNIIAAKALIAWLREAIKLKNKLNTQLSHYVSDEYTNLRMPEQPHVKTKEEILEEWDVKDRERYLTLETECAVIGNYIHPRGAFAKAKKNLFDRMVKPVETSLQGRDTIITYYTPVLTKDTVENKFFELQKRHRSAQAELNSLKNKLEKEEFEYKDKVSREYMKALDEYKAKKAELTEKDMLYVEEQRKRIEKLKIVIPPHHQAIYNLLTSK